MRSVRARQTERRLRLWVFHSVSIVERSSLRFSSRLGSKITKQTIDSVVDFSHLFRTPTPFVRMEFERELAVPLLHVVSGDPLTGSEPEHDARVWPGRLTRSRRSSALLLSTPEEVLRASSSCIDWVLRRTARWPREHVDDVFDAGVQMVVADLLSSEETTEQADELLARTSGTSGLVDDDSMRVTERRRARALTTTTLIAFDVGAARNFGSSGRRHNQRGSRCRSEAAPG